MSPWELNDHLGLLLVDAVPHPNLPQVRQITQRFARTWQGLWFEYGDRPEGRAHYRALLQRFIDEVRGRSQPMVLKNELRWFGALMTIVCKFAVGADRRAAGAPRRSSGEVGDNA